MVVQADQLHGYQGLRGQVGYVFKLTRIGEVEWIGHRQKKGSPKVGRIYIMSLWEGRDHIHSIPRTSPRLHNRKKEKSGA